MADEIHEPSWLQAVKEAVARLGDLGFEEDEDVYLLEEALAEIAAELASAHGLDDNTSLFDVLRTICPEKYIDDLGAMIAMVESAVAEYVYDSWGLEDVKEATEHFALNFVDELLNALRAG